MFPSKKEFWSKGNKWNYLKFYPVNHRSIVISFPNIILILFLKLFPSMFFIIKNLIEIATEVIMFSTSDRKEIKHKEAPSFLFVWFPLWTKKRRKIKGLLKKKWRKSLTITLHTLWFMQTNTLLYILLCS